MMEFHKNVNINIPSLQLSIIPFFPEKSGKNLRTFARVNTIKSTET